MISKRQPLELTQTAFEAIHELVARVKDRPGATVKVPKAALAMLLRDHSRLIAKLGEEL